jgi:predicted SAM-dependent methyltransferase
MKLNLGSSALTLEGFVNIDIEPTVGADLVHDIRRPLPFTDVEFVNMSQVLEHLSYLEARLVLVNCHAAMRPGARIRVSSPDMERLIQAWTAEEMLSFANVQPPLFVAVRSEMLRLSFLALGNLSADCSREHYTGHQLLLDFEAAKELLENAGFVDVVRVRFDPKLDCEAGRSHSFYAEARKGP